MEIFELIIYLLVEFKSIIGAILGTVAGVLISNYLKNKGNLEFHINNFEIKLTKQSAYGDQEASSLEEANSIKIMLDLDIYNFSEANRSIRDIKFKFNNELKDIVPNNTNTKKVAAGKTITEQIKIADFPPKKYSRLELEKFIDREYLDVLIKNKKIIFSYMNYKGKRISKKFDVQDEIAQIK